MSLSSGKNEGGWVEEFAGFGAGAREYTRPIVRKCFYWYRWFASNLSRSGLLFSDRVPLESGSRLRLTAKSTLVHNGTVIRMFRTGTVRGMTL